VPNYNLFGSDINCFKTLVIENEIEFYQILKIL